VAKDAGESAVLEAARADAQIAKFLPAAAKKVIYVAGRLLNVVG
jgi:leucyl-tRNA synthetase